ncbi:MAG: hypothetical protein RLZZ22_1999 [Pseudomonadota bacterium]|jgi:4'-phosphopantetheinyl transferase
MAPRLLAARERPALVAGQPLVWICQADAVPVREAARQLLRQQLAHYLRRPMAEVPLRFAPGQAPAVEARWKGLRLTPSLSYCGDLALVGLCAGARLGLDLAAVAPLPDWEGVARLYLGPLAVPRLARLEATARARRFAQDWAGMEAAGKCLGLPLEEWTPARQQRLEACQLSVSLAHWPDAPDGTAFAWALARGPCADR